MIICISGERLNDKGEANVEKKENGSFAKEETEKKAELFVEQ